MANISIQDLTYNLTSLNALNTSIKSKIFHSFNTSGFFILEGNNLEQSNDIFLSLSRWFGKVLDHEQANSQGVIPIRVMPNYPEYVNTKNDDLALHTDGSFESIPPKVMALYCEVAAKQGGETLLVDGKLVYEYVAKTDPTGLIALFEPEAFSIKRDSRSATRAIFTENNDRIYMAFRADNNANFSVHPKAVKAFNLIKNFVADSANQLIFKLQPNQILILDNTRILHGRTRFDINSQRQLNGLWFDGNCSESADLTIGFVPTTPTLLQSSVKLIATSSIL